MLVCTALYCPLKVVREYGPIMSPKHYAAVAAHAAKGMTRAWQQKQSQGRAAMQAGDAMQARDAVQEGQLQRRRSGLLVQAQQQSALDLKGREALLDLLAPGLSQVRTSSILHMHP